MSDDLASQLRWLRDRELIRELPQLYAYGIDTRDFDIVASVFHSDCVVSGTMRTEGIERYLKLLEPGVRQYHATMHFMGNQYLRVEGDAGHVETYAVAPLDRRRTTGFPCGPHESLAPAHQADGPGS